VTAAVAPNSALDYRYCKALIEYLVQPVSSIGCPVAGAALASLLHAAQS
jgi:hypothetical protein